VFAVICLRDVLAAVRHCLLLLTCLRLVRSSVKHCAIVGGGRGLDVTAMLLGRCVCHLVVVCAGLVCAVPVAGNRTLHVVRVVLWLSRCVLQLHT
jgi:hypothetical protein